MSDSSPDTAAAKRERIKAISRTIHSIPVEEGGRMRVARPVTQAEAEAPSNERFWRRSALAAGGVAGVALGMVAGLLLGRRR